MFLLCIWILTLRITGNFLHEQEYLSSRVKTRFVSMVRSSVGQLSLSATTRHKLALKLVSIREHARATKKLESTREARTLPGRSYKNYSFVVCKRYFGLFIKGKDYITCYVPRRNMFKFAYKKYAVRK